MIIKKTILFLTLLLSSLSLSSQVKIRLNIENQNNSIYYLLKYKSDKSCIIIDSSDFKKTLRNDLNYPEGIYILADCNQNPLFEILLGKDQKFSIDVENLMNLQTYKVKGCKTTSDYFKVHSKTIHDNIHIKALESEIKHYPDNVRKIDSIKKKLYDYQESMLNKDQTSFLNTYIKFIERNPEHEENIAEHYFDELPIYDNRILNSRLLKNKLDEYFNNIIAAQTSDYTCKKIDNLIAMADTCNNIRDYIIWHLYSIYFNNKDLKHEKTFIHLVDNYFSKLEINNLTPNIRDRIVKRADVLREITIGHIMPNLSYTDNYNNQASLEDIKSPYTVIIFYKEDCSKCHKAIRILSLIEKRHNTDLEIIRVNISDEEENQDIITRYDIMNVPKIYILDKEKKIITKDIEAEEIEFHIINR